MNQRLTERPSLFDRRRAPTAVLVVGLVLAVSFLISQARRLYFFGDDWSFLLDRDLSWHSLVEPHNEHWSTLPVLAFRIMVRIFGIDHYLAYAMMPIALHAGCCVLIYVLMRRHEIAAWPSVAAALLLAFLAGNIGENPLWDFQIGFLGSAVFGLLALIVAADDDLHPRRMVALWVVSALSMMCSGMAIPMLAWLGIYLWIRRDLWRALSATVPPAVFYLAWYVTYGRDAPDTTRPTADLVFSFAATGLATTWGAVLRVTDAGGAAFLVLVGVAVLAPLDVRQRLLALSGVLACVVSYFLLATSRAGLGPDAATASRYAYFAMLYTLPTFAAGLALMGERLADRAVARRWAFAVLTILLVGNGVAQAIAFTDGRRTLTNGLRSRILATEQLIGEDQQFLNPVLSPTYQPNVTVEALSMGEVKSELPTDPVSRQEVLDASVLLQTASSPTAFDLPTASAATVHGVQGSLKPGGCSRLKAGGEAWLDLPATPSGSQVALTTYATELPVQFIDGQIVSMANALTTTANGKVFIATTARRGTLRVTLPAGGYHVCLP